MQSDEDREYFQRRETQERNAAAAAEKGARNIHAELADRYAALSHPTRGKKVRPRPA